MTTRRNVFASILAAPLAFLGVRKPRKAASKLPTSCEILRSFDAREWAKAFVAIAKASPTTIRVCGTGETYIPLPDEDWMTTWFANALMRGCDQVSRQLDLEVADAGTGRVAYLSARAIRGAVARGWCTEENAHKEMDVALAEAITQELLKLRAGLVPGEVLDHHYVRFLEQPWHGPYAQGR